MTILLTSCLEKLFFRTKVAVKRLLREKTGQLTSVGLPLSSSSEAAHVLQPDPSCLTGSSSLSISPRALISTSHPVTRGPGPGETQKSFCGPRPPESQVLGGPSLAQTPWLCEGRETRLVSKALPIWTTSAGRPKPPPHAPTRRHSLSSP